MSQVENGEVRFQLKATRKLKTSRDGTWISQRVETRDLRSHDKWRKTFGEKMLNKPVDASTSLPGGVKASGLRDMQKHLVKGN